MSTFDTLAELQVRRKYYIGLCAKQSNSLKALVRRYVGYTGQEDEGEREKMSERAGRIVAAGLAGRPQKPEDDEAYSHVASVIAETKMGMEPFIKAREGVEKDMKKLVKTLPAYQWASDIRGFGDLGLAVLIAEAGDLSKYPTKGHLWKRLGLAPLGGQAMSTWRSKGGLTAEDWVEAGYSPRRRAEVHAVICDPLFRHQTMTDGPYRKVYDRRRETTALSHPDWTKGHSHMDAMRVMVKYLIRDLRREWIIDQGEQMLLAA